MPSSPRVAGSPRAAGRRVRGRTTVLFGNPDKASPRISAPTASSSPTSPPTTGRAQRLGADRRRPTPPSRHRRQEARHPHPTAGPTQPDTLLYLQDKDGDENCHIYCVNLKTNGPRPDPRQGRPPPDQLDRNFPNELLASINDRDPQYHDVYRINSAPASGAGAEEPRRRLHGPTTDFRVRCAQAHARRRHRDPLARRQGGWKASSSTGPRRRTNGASSASQADGNLLYMIDSEGRDTLGLVKRRTWRPARKR